MTSLRVSNVEISLPVPLNVCHDHELLNSLLSQTPDLDDLRRRCLSATRDIDRTIYYMAPSLHHAVDTTAICDPTSAADQHLQLTTAGAKAKLALDTCARNLDPSLRVLLLSARRRALAAAAAATQPLRDLAAELEAAPAAGQVAVTAAAAAATAAAATLPPALIRCAVESREQMHSEAYRLAEAALTRAVELGDTEGVLVAHKTLGGTAAGAAAAAAASALSELTLHIKTSNGEDTLLTVGTDLLRIGRLVHSHLTISKNLGAAPAPAVAAAGRVTLMVAVDAIISALESREESEFTILSTLDSLIPVLTSLLQATHSVAVIVFSATGAAANSFDTQASDATLLTEFTTKWTSLLSAAITTVREVAGSIPGGVGLSMDGWSNPISLALPDLFPATSIADWRLTVIAEAAAGGESTTTHAATVAFGVLTGAPYPPHTAGELVHGLRAGLERVDEPALASYPVTVARVAAFSVYVALSSGVCIDIDDDLVTLALAGWAQVGVVAQALLQQNQKRFIIDAKTSSILKTLPPENFSTALLASPGAIAAIAEEMPFIQGNNADDVPFVSANASGSSSPTSAPTPALAPAPTPALAPTSALWGAAPARANVSEAWRRAAAADTVVAAASAAARRKDVLRHPLSGHDLLSVLRSSISMSALATSFSSALTHHGQITGHAPSPLTSLAAAWIDAHAQAAAGAAVRVAGLVLAPQGLGHVVAGAALRGDEDPSSGLAEVALAATKDGKLGQQAYEHTLQVVLLQALTTVADNGPEAAGHVQRIVASALAPSTTPAVTAALEFARIVATGLVVGSEAGAEAWIGAAVDHGVSKSVMETMLRSNPWFKGLPRKGKTTVLQMMKKND